MGGKEGLGGGINDQARQDTGFLAAWARRCDDTRAASRACAIAHALESLSRAEAARLAGMERQALRDAEVRYNAERGERLSGRPRSRPSRLTKGQQAALRVLILRDPNPECDGVSSWARANGTAAQNLPTLQIAG